MPNVQERRESKCKQNYRGVTLICTAYNIYTMITEKRLREEIDRLQLLLETQAGFRKGRSVIDNIYILKIAAEKTTNKKKDKLFSFFVDLKGKDMEVFEGKRYKGECDKKHRKDIQRN